MFLFYEIINTLYLCNIIKANLMCQKAQLDRKG